MGIAYVVCLVALLQMSLCQNTDNSTPETPVTESGSTLVTDTTLNSQEASTEPSSQEPSFPDTTELTTTVKDTEVPQSMPYEPVGSDNATTTTVQPEPEPSSPTSTPAHASSLTTGALALVLPLCARLVSSKVHGLV